LVGNPQNFKQGVLTKKYLFLLFSPSLLERKENKDFGLKLKDEEQKL